MWGNYEFQREKGEQKGKIYLFPAKQFIGEVIDTNEKFRIMGKINENKLVLVKFPEKDNYLPVYWELREKEKFTYGGNFCFLNLPLDFTKKMYSNIEEKLKIIKNKTAKNLESEIKTIISDFVLVANKHAPFAYQGSGKIRIK